MNEARDSSGRRSRTRPTSTSKRVTPQPRDLLWFEKLHQHGPLASSFLLAYARDTHRSDKRARERLTDLFNETNTPHGGAYLTRPPQQFRTIDSRYNQLVYDLAPAARRALIEQGLQCEQATARTGPWLHSFMVSSITASIELAVARREDITYIPQAAILERATTNLRYPVSIADPSSKKEVAKDLIPDALFGLEYHTPAGSRFRFFLVEADRATEPANSDNINRKSMLRSLRQYQAYLERGLYKRHLQLTAPLLVLFVANDPRRCEQMIRLLQAKTPGIRSHLLFQSWADFGEVYRPPTPNSALLEETWTRADMQAFRLDRV